MRRVSIGSSRDKNGSFPGSNRRSSLPGIMSNNKSHFGKYGNTLEKDMTKNGPLPRIRRIHESEIGNPAFSNSSHHKNSPIYSPSGEKNVPVIHGSSSLVSSPRRYPTHQPQFSGLGILPSVRLNKPARAVLSEQNSTMLNNSVTVKVAPPDVLKAPTPVFIQVSSKKPETPSVTNTCDPESVLSALREKRKRNLGEDEECVPASPDSKQVNKRRRKVEEEDANGDTVHTQGLTGKDQAKLPSKRPATEDEDCNDESQKRLRPERKKAVGVKNALEASFSSSKRWIEKSLDVLNRSRDSSLSRSHRSFSAEPCMYSRQTSRTTSQSNTPRHSITLDEDVVMTSEVGNLSNTSTPIPGTSGRTTPLTDGEQSDSISTPILATPKNKPLVHKEGSTKRRLMPSSSSSDDYARVPRLRYQLTSEDFEKDRKTDIDRVKQLMNDVDEEYNKKNEKKKSIFNSEKEEDKTEVPTSSTLNSVSGSSRNSDNKPVTGGFSGFALSTSKPTMSVASISSLNVSTSNQMSASSQMVSSTSVTSVNLQPVSSSNLAPTTIGITGLTSTVTVPVSSTSLTNTDRTSNLKALLNENKEILSPVTTSSCQPSVSSVNTTTTTSSGASEVNFKPVFGAQTQAESSSLTKVTSAPQTTIGGFKFSGSIGVPLCTASGLSFGIGRAATAVASTTGSTTSLTSETTGQTSSATLPSPANPSFPFAKSTGSTSTLAGGMSFTAGNNTANSLATNTSIGSNTGCFQLATSTVGGGSMATDSVLNLSKPKVNDIQTSTGLFNFGQKVDGTPKTNSSSFSFGSGVQSQTVPSVFSVNNSLQSQTSSTATPFGASQPGNQPATVGMFGASNKIQTQNAPVFQFGNTAKPSVASTQPSSTQGLFSFGAPNKTETKSGSVPTFGNSGTTQHLNNTPTFGQPSNSLSGSFASSSNSTSGFGVTFGATSTTPQQASSFSFGAKALSSTPAPGFGATPSIQQNGFPGGNGQQTANQSKGFNFTPSSGGNASFNFGQSPAPVQFGSPSAAQSPGSNMFSVGSTSAAPRPRNIKTAARRKPQKR